MSKKHPTNWRVKIIGIPKRTSASSLAKELNIAVRRIVIPLVQNNPNYWYAWIHGFENEYQAAECADEWTGKKIYDNYEIKCKACEKLSGNQNQITNIKLDDSSANSFICSVSTENNETNDSEDLASEASSATSDSQTFELEIDGTRNRSPITSFIYRTRESSLSSQNSGRSNSPLCFYESKCYNQDCILRHPPNRHICEDGIQCDDYQCTGNHPPQRPGPCPAGSSCFKATCCLLHPKKQFTECVLGEDCRNVDCHALHPLTRPVPCQYGKHCYNTMCLCLHPLDRQLCIRGAECMEFECEHIHPPGRPVICQDGLNCENVHCSRLHPIQWNPKEDVNQQLQEAMMDMRQNNKHKLKSFSERVKERLKMQLPILASRTDFCARLNAERLLVVTAETGSGKSTQLPQYAAEHFHDGLISPPMQHKFPRY